MGRAIVARCAKHLGNPETRRTHSTSETSGKSSWKWEMSAELYLEKEMVGLVSETGRDGTEWQQDAGGGRQPAWVHLAAVYPQANYLLLCVSGSSSLRWR